MTELRLDPDRIIETGRRLQDRIEDRFPGSGLGRLARRLSSIAEQTVGRIERVAKPNIPLRLGIGILIVALPVSIIELVLRADVPARPGDLFQFLEGLEAGFSGLILMGAALIFLVTLEGRIKRRRALRFLRELRALAHIVDMHQLTKDPNQMILGSEGSATATRELDRWGLARYLDYCSEMLSLVSKIAALYAQTFDDQVVLAAVDEVESLTAGLSGKIWQKIVILDLGAFEATDPRLAPRPPGGAGAY